MVHYTRPRGMGALGYTVILLAFALAGSSVVHRISALLDRPEVRFSYYDKKCVEVRDYKAEADGRPSQWSCDRLPDEYERVWVY